MNLQDQVCSLEFAKKLKELGVKQRSLFRWVAKKDKLLVEGVRIFGIVYLDWFYDLKNEKLDNYECYSAFTVAELGEIINCDFNHNFICGNYPPTKQYFCCSIIKNKTSHIEINENEANSRAKMLIYLIENKLMELSNDGQC